MFSSQNLSYRNRRKVFRLANKGCYALRRHLWVRCTQAEVLTTNALVALVSLPLIRGAKVDVCYTSHIQFLIR